MNGTRKIEIGDDIMNDLIILYPEYENDIRGIFKYANKLCTFWDNILKFGFFLVKK